MGKPSSNSAYILRGAWSVVGLLCLLVGCGKRVDHSQPVSPVAADRTSIEQPNARNEQDIVRDIVATEEAILAITPQLKLLGQDFDNLSFPGGSGNTLWRT